MTYKLCDGIVYSKVSNVHMLIATRKVWDRFPAVRKLSPLQGCFCYGIQEQMSEDELMDFLILPPHMKKEAVRKAYHRFLETMTREGYLITEGEADDC